MCLFWLLIDLLVNAYELDCLCRSCIYHCIDTRGESFILVLELHMRYMIGFFFFFLIYGVLDCLHFLSELNRLLVLANSAL